MIFYKKDSVEFNSIKPWHPVYICGLIIFLLVFLGSVVHAQDGWELNDRPRVCSMSNGPRLIQCQEWISTVKRPDTRTSCCGEADAFIVDDFEIVGGELYAIISLDYPDIGEYKGFKKGDRILVSKDKINIDQDDAGNVSGHGVVFISLSTRTVFCFFFPTLF